MELSDRNCLTHYCQNIRGREYALRTLLWTFYIMYTWFIFVELPSLDRGVGTALIEELLPAERRLEGGFGHLVRPLLLSLPDLPLLKCFHQPGGSYGILSTNLTFRSSFIPCLTFWLYRVSFFILYLFSLETLYRLLSLDICCAPESNLLVLLLGFATLPLSRSLFWILAPRPNNY